MASDDQSLAVAAAAGGDPVLYGELVRRHQSQVRGFLRRLCGDPAWADDLAQDTFIRAWDKLESYTGEGRFSAWVMKIAYNEFLQGLRKNRREQHLAERLREEPSVQPLNAGGASVTGLAELADVERLLAVLSEEEKLAMVLAYAYGFSHGEICEVTGLALGTVKSHIHRGKARIRERYGEGGDNDGRS